jgi:type II secretory pathway component PulK
MGRKLSLFGAQTGTAVDRTADYLPINDASVADASKNKSILVNELLIALRGPATALGNTGTVSLNPALGDVFTTAPSGDMTINASSALLGARVSIVVTTPDTTSRTLTFGTNFKTTGTLATGTVASKVFTISFIGDGTNLNEVSRTTAM